MYRFLKRTELGFLHHSKAKEAVQNLYLYIKALNDLSGQAFQALYAFKIDSSTYVQTKYTFRNSSFVHLLKYQYLKFQSGIIFILFRLQTPLSSI